jgi:hypothetical protein
MMFVQAVQPPADHTAVFLAPCSLKRNCHFKNHTNFFYPPKSGEKIKAPSAV